MKRVIRSYNSNAVITISDVIINKAGSTRTLLLLCQYGVTPPQLQEQIHAVRSCAEVSQPTAVVSDS